ncbi:putative synaptic vesicle transporter svop [Phaeomoniella chlamydospora]|uniref:Putative synaptic vesicle transporter svop n=1 Tax=Phaeomoniella chlamydospora TaxID=158046 RepID=A0A0G2EAI1_PHACM|nr:putative synaptic vesicle transporter svop [Phaeomoniella chlamydospora]
MKANESVKIYWRRTTRMATSSCSRDQAEIQMTHCIDAATPTWTPMHEQLGFSYEILNDSYAVGCGTLSFGAMQLIPFALKFGRRPVYVLSTAGQFAVSVWSAKLQTVADIMLVNAFSCWLGALAEVLVQMTVADVFFVHQRGVMNSMYVWFVNVGASLAPVAAGYITLSQGWRWVWWWNAIFFAVALVLFLFCYEETKYTPPAIEGIPRVMVQDPLAGAEQKAHDVESKTVMEKAEPKTAEAAVDDGVSQNLTKIEIDPTTPKKTYLQKLTLWTSTPGSWNEFFRHSWQPVVILFTRPRCKSATYTMRAAKKTIYATFDNLILFSIVPYLDLYHNPDSAQNPSVFFMSLLYGTLIATSCVQITTLSSWMALPPYNFNSAQIGLMSLPGWIGTTIGALITGPISDWLILFLSRRNNGIYEPEMRLWVIIAFIPFVPAGLFMFGIGLAKGASWPILAMGSAICAFGTTPASSISLTYITDSYTEVSSPLFLFALNPLTPSPQIVADALVSVTFTRNLISMIFVFAATPWIASVGMQNVYITIGVLLTAVLLGNFVFIIWGKQFRVMTREKYRAWARRQFGGRGGV